MTGSDTFGQDFIRLGLRINRHIEGYVDAYFGPPELKEEVESEAKKPVAELREQAARLRDSIPPDDPARAAYLKALLRAIDTALRIQAGEKIPYLEEVEALYDIKPHKVDESRFSAAHTALDALLPGAGPINERLAANRRQYDTPIDKLPRLLELARHETRERTRKIIDLPEDELVDYRLVKDKPWSAYNWYQGNAHSLIEFNTDLPVNALGILDLWAHEGYPGHHTEAVLKEQKFFKEKGYGEAAIFILTSPGAVIAEAIATTAREIIFPADSHHAWTMEHLLPAAGLKGEDPDIRRRIVDAARELRYVTGNAAIMYHTGELDKEKAIDYVITYGKTTPERAARSFGFFSHPLYRAYIFTYTWGYDLLAAAAGDDDKTPLFKRLLTEAILPSTLAQLAKDKTDESTPKADKGEK
jgi:hypothetical protein